MKRLLLSVVIIGTLLIASIVVADEPPTLENQPSIKIGSKAFIESVVLGEMVAALAKNSGARTEHITRLGGTRLAWEALVNGEIDVYPEYTGTIIQEILAGLELKSDTEIRRALSERGIVMSRPLGFNNTYALGMQEKRAEELNIRNISDLAGHAELKLGFSSEFMDRSDGWPGLKAIYRLPQEDVHGLSHDLAYRGLVGGSLDAIDLYTTDAEIAEYGLRTLEDDRGYFPTYDAVLLYRRALQQESPEVVASILRLENHISAEQMRALNADVKLQKQSEARVAADFVLAEFGVDVPVQAEDTAASIWKHTREHLYLTSISLFAAIIVSIPLGIFAAKQRLAGQIVLSTVGIVQTIPSLALFAFLIPLFGIGAWPAIFALFLYSLLAIVRNTYSGLHDIPPQLRESALALGLPAGARLRLIELPMAARSILSGIKTATVINVGTATLGGFIGAGGYGEPIFTGISRGDRNMILEGAIPAAIMALLAQGIFELAERWLVPKGLRVTSHAE